MPSSSTSSEREIPSVLDEGGKFGTLDSGGTGAPPSSTIQAHNFVSVRKIRTVGSDVWVVVKEPCVGSIQEGHKICGLPEKEKDQKFGKAVGKCANCHVLQTTITKLEEEKQVQNAMNHSLQGKLLDSITKLEEENRKQNAVNCGFQRKLNAMKKKGEKLASENNELHERVKDVEKENNKLKEGKKALSLEINCRMEEIAELSEKCEDQIEKSDKVEKALSLEINDLQKEFLGKCEEYKENEAKLCSNISELKGQINFQEIALGSSKRKCTNQKKYIDALERQVEQQEGLTARLIESEEGLDKMREELNDSRERNVELADMVDALNARLSCVEGQEEGSRSFRDQIQQIINGLRYPQQPVMNVQLQPPGQLPPEDVIQTVLTALGGVNLFAPD